MKHTVNQSKNIQRCLDQWKKTHEQYTNHTRDMSISEHEMTVPDDKNKKSLWVIRRLQYPVVLAGYVTNSKTWKFTPGTKEEALEEMKQKLKRDVPLRLQRQLKVMVPGNDKWIPHVYCSIKTKCHDVNGQGRTCMKEAHSCCGKIVSTQWKVNGKWKHIGRAMETMTKRCSGGSETWTLKSAANELRDKIQRVRTATREPTTRCQRCGTGKRQWEGIVADAGQFYEACFAQKVEKSPKEIGAAWIRQTGTTTITVEHCKGRKAWAGGAIKSVSVTTCTYEVAEVLMALRACSRANVVSIGDATATFTGLPIGGVMSKAACSAVLNHEENAWKRGKCTCSPGIRNG